MTRINRATHKQYPNTPNEQNNSQAVPKMSQGNLHKQSKPTDKQEYEHSDLDG